MSFRLKLQGPQLTLTALNAEDLKRTRWDPEDEDARVLFTERLHADPGARGWW